MHLPQPIATDIHDESFAGVTYHIRGQLVPELQVELSDQRVIHGHGNVFEVHLDAGEQLDVEAGAWLFKDPTVKLESVSMGLKTGIFAGGGKLTWNRFTGPGRLALQTMFVSPTEAVEGGGTAQAAATGGVAGALMKGLGG